MAMTMVDVVYLILHYLTIEDTKKCVESIEEINHKQSYKIIIVDNGSPNGTGISLKRMFAKNDHIDILLLENNLGFANGNNVGYKFYKENYKSKFLIVLNNDVVIKQSDFYENLLKVNSCLSHVAAIGPKIILPNNLNTPLYSTLPSQKNIKKRILKIQIMILCDYLRLRKLSKYLYNIRLGKSVTDSKDECERKNIILHGSFIILTELFVEKFNEIFDPRTFLYCEEELLFLKLKRKGLDTFYTPKLEVFHNEDSSTNALTKTETKKRMFKNKCLLKSYRILLDELRKG